MAGAGADAKVHGVTDAGADAKVVVRPSFVLTHHPPADAGHRIELEPIGSTLSGSVTMLRFAVRAPRAAGTAAACAS